MTLCLKPNHIRVHSCKHIIVVDIPKPKEPGSSWGPLKPFDHSHSEKPVHECCLFLQAHRGPLEQALTNSTHRHRGADHSWCHPCLAAQCQPALSPCSCTQQSVGRTGISRFVFAPAKGPAPTNRWKQEWVVMSGQFLSGTKLSLKTSHQSPGHLHTHSRGWVYLRVHILIRHSSKVVKVIYS